MFIKPSAPLVDGFGRRIEYLRVSITERCNLACAYCMPAGMKTNSGRCDMLRFRDHLRLISIFAGLGVRKVRITGGEPLVRKGVVSFIRQVNAIPGIEQIALTTNGVLLPRLAGELKNAGVARINISLDTLDKNRFGHITGRDGYGEAIEGIKAAIESGFGSVKINMVVIGGVNDGEVEAFAALSRYMPVQVRFIEFMPASPDVWDERRLVTMDRVKERIARTGKLTPCAPEQWGGPAEIYRFEKAAGQLGFISAVSRHFCESCNRLRLTSSGGLLTCLFGESETDLKHLVETGADDGAIIEVIRKAVAGKNRVRDMDRAKKRGPKNIMRCVGG